jgi:hypothetical protein
VPRLPRASRTMKSQLRSLAPMFFLACLQPASLRLLGLGIRPCCSLVFFFSIPENQEEALSILLSAKRAPAPHS